jgi:hypothetical protein
LARLGWLILYDWYGSKLKEVKNPKKEKGKRNDEKEAEKELH